MGSSAYDHIAHFCLILAQSQPAVPTPSGLSVYGQWGLATAVIAALIALGKLMADIFNKEHADVVGARLSLEQVASAFFVRIVLQEARRVFQVVDDHMPHALGQTSATIPETSRFAAFCQSLRKLSADELEDRSKYASIIKDCFGGIISDAAGRLIDAMVTSGGQASNTVLNPTTARFSLEGDGFLSFSGVSEFDYFNRRAEARFNNLWTLVGVCALLSIIAGFGVLPGVVLDRPWAQLTAPWFLLSHYIFAAFALAMYGLSYVAKRRFIRRAQKYGDPSSVEEFVKQKKAANGHKDH